MAGRKQPTKAPPPSVQDTEEVPVSLSEPEEPISILPPLIITNPHLKIEPKFISQSSVFKVKKKKEDLEITALIWTERGVNKKPIPKHPIFLSWWPNKLCFRLGKNAAVTKKICISNRSPKIMYIHCCGLWDDTARLGASWRCYPRTRILLAPGLVAEMFIKAKPREESPVPVACAGLQLATAHRKDTVFGYFVIPIAVSFYNYVPPEIIEFEGEIVE